MLRAHTVENTQGHNSMHSFLWDIFLRVVAFDHACRLVCKTMISEYSRVESAWLLDDERWPNSNDVNR